MLKPKCSVGGNHGMLETLGTALSVAQATFASLQPELDLGCFRLNVGEASDLTTQWSRVHISTDEEPLDWSLTRVSIENNFEEAICNRKGTGEMPSGSFFLASHHCVDISLIVHLV